MSIIIFAETWNNKFKKSSLEAISYGSEMAKKMNLQTIAIVVGKCENLNTLGKYGANKVIKQLLIMNLNPTLILIYQN